MTTIQPSVSKRVGAYSPLHPVRPNWRDAFGPLNLRMPVDPAVPFDGVHHEDSRDGYVFTQSWWGPEDPGEVGGSGIAFGYAWDDERVVAQAAIACRARPVWYNWEHYVRQFRYAIAWWEMTRDPLAASLIEEYARAAEARFQGVVYDGPEYVPDNVDQYLHLARQNPATGTSANLRQLGWAAYIVAMALKVNPNRSTQFAGKLLTLFSTAAFTYTGSLGVVPSYGGNDTVDQPSQYTFHWAIAAHGAMALCKQLAFAPPWWVSTGLNALSSLPRLDYYGAPSIPAFTYTDATGIHAATGLGQHGDPAFGYWSTNCVALSSFPGPYGAWKDQALEIGPTTADTEADRQLTMLARGAGVQS